MVSSVWIVMAHGECHGAFATQELAHGYIDHFLEEGGHDRQFDWDEDSFEVMPAGMYTKPEDYK